MKKSLLFLVVMLFSVSIQAQWSIIPQDTILPISSISSVDWEVTWFAGDGGIIKKTTDAGVSFKTIKPADLNGEDILNIFAIDKNTAYVTTSPSDSYIYKTTNGGANWAKIFTQPGGFFDVIHFWDANNGVIIGDPVGGRFSIFKTTNAGATWDSTGMYAASTSSSEYGLNNSYGVLGDHIVIGTNNYRVLHSGDRGMTWNSIATPALKNIFSIYFNSENVGYVAGYTGSGTSKAGVLLKTTDGAQTWNSITIPVPNTTVYGVIGYGSQVYIANSNIIAGSTDDGATWTNAFTSTTANIYGGLVQSRGSNTAWAFDGGGLLTRGADVNLPVELTSFTANVEANNVILKWDTKTEINNRGFEVERKSGNGSFNTVGFIKGNGTSTSSNSYQFTDSKMNLGKYTYRIKQLDFNGNYSYSDNVEVNVNALSTFALNQNYPNPFNPTTQISFNLPNSGNVKLAVFNVLGQQVSSLINGYKEAGNYTVTFNASNLPSGAYFYKLETAGFTQTKKMLLSK